MYEAADIRKKMETIALIGISAKEANSPADAQEVCVNGDRLFAFSSRDDPHARISSAHSNPTSPINLIRLHRNRGEQL